MVITHKHYLAASVNIDREINSPRGHQPVPHHRLRRPRRVPHHEQHQPLLVHHRAHRRAGQVRAWSLPELVLHDRLHLPDGVRPGRAVHPGRVRRAAPSTSSGATPTTTCFAQDMIWDRCTISAGSTVFAASQGSYACRFINCNAFGRCEAGPVLLRRRRTRDAGVPVHRQPRRGRWAATSRASPAATGASSSGTTSSRCRRRTAFNLYGAAVNSNISFVGNFVVLYAGPFVYCGPTASHLLGGELPHDHRGHAGREPLPVRQRGRGRLTSSASATTSRRATRRRCPMLPPDRS